MNRILKLLALGVIVGISSAEPRTSLADEQSASAKAQDETKIVRMTIHSACEPDPALNYSLLPELLDRKPGNAVILYGIAIDMLDDKEKDKVRAWLEMPLDQLPRQEARAIIGGRIMRQIELAARREKCEWDLPIHEQGFDLLLPPLGKYRAMARLIALDARLLMAEGRYDEAIGKLQTGFAMARHVAEGPTVIHALVGVAIGSYMADQTAELMQAPNSPNLYWALSWLPQPFVDLRRPMEWERSSLYLTAPGLREPNREKLEPQELLRQLGSVLSLIGYSDDLPSPDSVVGMTAWSLKMYPEAKRRLIASGRSLEQVEAMPVAQVLAIHHLTEYEHWRDELFKWHAVPYWQASEAWRRAEQDFNEARRTGSGGPLLGLLPALRLAKVLTTGLDRDIAALRCIEAIRMYAADHDGKLPAKLSDITRVLVPLNPLTGKCFGYEVKGDTATLYAPVPPGDRQRESTRYEITLAK